MSLPVSTARPNSRATAPKPEPPELAPKPLEELPEAGTGAGAGALPEKGNGSAAPEVVCAVVAAVTKELRSEESSLAEKRGSVRTR